MSRTDAEPRRRTGMSAPLKRDIGSPSRQKRGLKNGLFVSRNGKETGNGWRNEMSARPEVPKPSRRSRGRNRNGSGTMPEPQPWAGLLALDGRMRVAFPASSIASGTIATTDVHHSGASAAEFHRLPDAPKASERILRSLA